MKAGDELNRHAYIIRPMQSSDVSIIRQIHDDSLEVSYPDSYYMNLEAGKHFGFVAQNIHDDGENEVNIVGVLTADITFKEFSDTLQNYLHVYIMSLAVRSEWRCHGIGHALLATLIQFCDNCIVCRGNKDYPNTLCHQNLCEHIGKFTKYKLTLHTLQQNLPAQRLYESLEFKHTQIVPNHYYFESQYHNAYKYQLIRAFSKSADCEMGIPSEGMIVTESSQSLNLTDTYNPTDLSRYIINFEIVGALYSFYLRVRQTIGTIFSWDRTE